jgi:tetratricopeptide (TPR) repeat protein
MASELRQAAAEQGIQLVAISTALRLGDRAASASASGEIAAWITRIRNLMDREEFETAERLIDTALNDFPGSLELAHMRALLPASAGRARTSAQVATNDPATNEIRERLLQLLELEKQGRLQEALAHAQAFSQTNSALALKVAEAYYQRRTETPIDLSLSPR